MISKPREYIIIFSRDMIRNVHMKAAFAGKVLM